MKKTALFALLILLYCCGDNQYSKTQEFNVASNETSKSNSSELINKEANTINKRFPAPDGYSWIEEKSNSFGFYIENFPLKKYNSPILKYDGSEIETQHLHEAVFDIDIGTKDLQQCADALIRLRAEYLYKNKRFDEIKFHFTSGDLMTWNAYKNGTRAFVNGNSVEFRKTEKADESYLNFRKYLDLIFNYAGTISLNKETKQVLKNSDLKTGDLLITAGSPGHIVFVAGVSQNKQGKKLFLLAQGFTPAQSIHVLKNPFDLTISPWYELDVNASETETARYLFEPSNFRSF